MKQLWIYSLGILLVGIWPVWGLGITSPPNAIARAERPDRAEVLHALKRADIIYLGETHDSRADHRAQLEILRSLHAKNPQLAIGMEMFQRPFQTVINAYLAGNLSEAELVEKSEYERRWGFPWEYYAPILRFAKEKQLPVLALNAPSEVVRKVAREGLETLSDRERQYLPPLEEIRTDDPDYRAMLAAVFEHHAGHGHSNSFDRFFSAQVVWDETMAETIVQFYRANPERQVVVLAGKGHVVYGYGIPSRVERRLSDRALRQETVWLGSEPAGLRDRDRAADHFWIH